VKHRILTVLIAAMMAAQLLSVTTVTGQTIKQLSEQEKADTGANWVYTVKFGDLDTDASNTAETVTMNVVAKQGVRLVSMTLPTAFDTANTNYVGSLVVTVGDGTDADLFLESTELASDGTEVFLKMGRETAQTLTTSATNLLAVSTDNVTTTKVSYAFATATANNPFGSKVYTGSDTIDFVFTPNVQESTGSNTVGEVRFYFNLWDATKR